MEEELTIDLREVFVILKNHLLIILATTLLFGIGGGLGTRFFITPQYKASATMIVNTRQDQNTNVTNDQITSAKNLVSTYSIIVKSDTVLQPVIETLKLGTTYEVLKNKVEVSAVDSTQVMSVSVKDPDPQQAKAIVEEITKVAPDVIKEMVEAGSVKVISAARASENPVSPSMKKNVAISAMLGIVLSSGCVFLKELLNNTFKTDEDIKNKLELVVLGVIPEVQD